MAQYGCTLLTAAAHTVSGRLLATKLSGPRIVLSLLNMHMESAPVVREALRALSTLSSNNVPNQRMMGEKGAIANVIEALELHVADPGTVLEACRMLSSLCILESKTVGVGYNQHLCKMLMFEDVPVVMNSLTERFANNAAVIAAVEQVLTCTSKSYSFATEDANVVMGEMKQHVVEQEMKQHVVEQERDHEAEAEEEAYGHFPSSRGTVDTDTIEQLIGREVTPTASEVGYAGWIPRPPSYRPPSTASSRTVTPSWKGAATKRRDLKKANHPDRVRAMKLLARVLRELARGECAVALHSWHDYYMQGLVMGIGEAEREIELISRGGMD